MALHDDIVTIAAEAGGTVVPDLAARRYNERMIPSSPASLLPVGFDGLSLRRRLQAKRLASGGEGEGGKHVLAASADQADPVVRHDPNDPIDSIDSIEPIEPFDPFDRWTIECVPQTGSTNADLLDAFARRVPPLRFELQALNQPLSWSDSCRHFPPTLRVALQQSAGRGRMGRQWLSAPGNSLLFSVAVVMPRSMAGLSGLSLAVGMSVLEGLQDLPIDPDRLRLKWPNDILLDDKKLGGILIETAAATKHASALVIGIGINLRGEWRLDPAGAPLPAANLAAALPAPLAETGTHELLMDALAGILAALEKTLCRFSAEGFEPFRAPWWTVHRYANCAVSIIDGGTEQFRGTAVGIDEWGRLLIAPDAVDSAAGQAALLPALPALRAISSGDVSMRPVTNEMPMVSAVVSSPAASTVLLIDAGNTRIKWSLRFDRQRIARENALKNGYAGPFGQLAHPLDPDAQRTLLSEWAALPAPSAIWISNVAGAAVGEQIAAWREQVWPNVPHTTIVAQASQHGVVNGYKLPAQLGSDRWAGMIGARTRYPDEALLIATLGTATTIDIVDFDGQFLGGLIAPGWKLMLRSLGEHTAQLPVLENDAGKSIPSDPFARDTASGLIEGCRLAQVGLIETAWRNACSRLEATGRGKVRCLISGGAAPDVIPGLTIPFTRHDSLVMDGLARIAGID